MTHKFIHTEDETEFLIPNIFDKNSEFIGLETGTSYKSGIVVFTGKELTPDLVLEKVLLNNQLSFFQKITTKRKLKSFLAQIESFKIGAIVSFDHALKLVQVQ